jgi:glycosyltransferase involved in cell wall biosynthesis
MMAARQASARDANEAPVKVSIVTTSYNQGEFLERAILSVLEQDYADIEFIIIDPGSTDGSREIVERYRAHFASVLFERDDGPADGLNRAFARATGEICNFLHSDDMLLPGAVRKAVDAFRVTPDADVVYGHGYMIDERDRIRRRLHSTPYELRNYVYGGVLVVEQAAYFKRSALLDVGGFNPQTRCAFDGELWFRFARASKRFRLVNDYWGLFRVHSRSMTGSGSHDREYHDLQRRMFLEVVGREPGFMDRLRCWQTRAAKWRRDPVSAALRAMDRLGSPHFIAHLPRESALSR